MLHKKVITTLDGGCNVVYMVDSVVGSRSDGASQVMQGAFTGADHSCTDA